MNMKRWLIVNYAAIIVLVIFVGCSTLSSGLIITGITLRGTGDQFVRIAPLYKHGCDVTKTIAESKCQDFRRFGEKFQRSFPLAAQLWEAARSASDARMQKNVEEIIRDLTDTLTEFAAQVFTAA